MIEQLATTLPTDHTKDVYALIGLIVTQIATVAVMVLNGRKKSRDASTDLGLKLKPITEGIGRVEGKVEEIALDMREQKVRMESVETKVDGLESRERQNLRVGEYDRRVS